MKNFNKALYALMMAIFINASLGAQITIVETFNASSSLPTGWANLTGGGSGSVTTTTPCSGGTGTARSVRKNQFILSTNTANWLFAAPLGTSNGGDLAIAFDYKLINFSGGAATPNTPNWGTIKVQVSVDGGTTWTIDVGEINSTNHVPSTTCSTINYTVPAASVPNGNSVRVRWNCNIPSGTPDYYVYLDNVSITQQATTPPSCSTTPVPANAATGITLGQQLGWAVAAGATSYDVYFGTTMSPPLVGNVATNAYNPGTLAASTTYYWRVEPKNAFGAATGCTEWSFTTYTPPPGDLCANAIDLSMQTSPYSSTTVGAGNDFTNTCASGNIGSDLVFFIDVLNGQQITIGQTVNGYDSEHVVSYGASCPSTITSISSVQLACQDDPDIENVVWTNTTGSTQTVWWIQDGFSTSSNAAGTFTLAWTVGCGAPTTLSTSSITTTAANLVWLNGGPNMQIEYGAAGFTLGTGTAVTATTSPYNLTSLTPGTTYDWYIRQDCGGSFSTWTGPNTFSTLSACTNPSTLAASNTTTTTTDLAWTENGTATIWDIYRATTATPVPTSGTTPTYNDVTNPHTATGLNSSTTYYFWVRADCGSSTSNWIGPITVTTLLGNDESTTPTLLTVGAGCTGAPYTNVGSTLSTGEPYPNCSGVAVAPVWFSFVAPTSGTVRVSTELGTPTFTDSKIAIFDSGLNIISCDDDGGAGSTNGGIGSGFLSVVYAFDLVPGATYLIAVDKYASSTTSGTFCIAVDALTSSMLTTLDCGGSFQTPASNSNTTYAGWVPLLDGTAKLVAMVRNPAGGAVSTYTVEATTTTGAVRQATNGIYYLNRNFKINSTATNVEVLLPFLTTEMDDLTAVAPTATIASVGVTRVSTTTCSANFAGTPANTTFIPQASNGSTGSVDYISFTTPSFSNFYINADAALPIELKSFTGKPLAASNMLEWKTATEQNVRAHVIERSADGYSNWTVVGSTPSKGDARVDQSYSMEDHLPLAKSFYRLRTIDFDNKEQLSNIISIIRQNNNFGVVGAYPNPATSAISVQFNTLEEGSVTARIVDMTGRLVKEQQMEAEKGTNTITLQLNTMSAGTYFITLQSANETTAPVRFVKD